MNALEHELNYPWPDLPELGRVQPLLPGIGWIRMRLPFALDHINLWLLDDELNGRRGFTQVDCGITSDETRAAWETIFDSTFESKPLLRLIATHFHPDHLGLAWWLAAGGDRGRWHAPLYMSATEYAYGRMLSAGGDDTAGDGAAAHFARHGLSDAAALAQVRLRGSSYYPHLVPAVPAAYRRLHAGDMLTVGVGEGGQRDWRVIVGFGHSPEHVSLFNERDGVLIAGDMVLPRISTNVSVFDLEPEANPLPLYLRSLDALRKLPADTCVLPSHGRPFIGLHRRIDQQHAHHAARLDEVRAACVTPQTAASIVPVLFKRTLDLHQTTFALGEALAHLHALWFDGLLERTLDDGVYRFVAR